MDLTRHRATEDRFLGCLLGLAIGDALGRPVRGLAADAISGEHGEIRGYIADADTTPDQPPGEISDKSEVVLALVESLTTNDGLIDPVNINARLSFLVRGPSRAMMSEAVIAGVEAAIDTDGLVDADRSDVPELAVGLRGVPVGLVHAVGAYDGAILARESAQVSRLSHGGAAQRDLTASVARAVCAAARFGGEVDLWDEVLDREPASEPVGSQVAAIVAAVREAARYEDPVLEQVAKGGDADAQGALAGALAGARFGASGIPQALIDGLDARIYISLAAPWFYRTAKRRAGTVIDLRLIQ